MNKDKYTFIIGFEEEDFEKIFDASSTVKSVFERCCEATDGGTISQIRGLHKGEYQFGYKMEFVVEKGFDIFQLTDIMKDLREFGIEKIHAERIEVESFSRYFNLSKI